MRHAYDINPTIHRRIEDDVSTEREAAHPTRELFSSAPHQRMRRKTLELFVELF